MIKDIKAEKDRYKQELEKSKQEKYIYLYLVAKRKKMIFSIRLWSS